MVSGGYHHCHRHGHHHLHLYLAPLQREETAMCGQGDAVTAEEHQVGAVPGGEDMRTLGH